MSLPLAKEHRARVEKFQRKHRVGLVTLVFTDMVGSTRLKQDLGDRDAVAASRPTAAAWPQARAMAASTFGTWKPVAKFSS
jgi:class 3 adenylate cyclase